MSKTEHYLKRFDALLGGLALMEDDGCIHQAYSVVLAGEDSERRVQLLAEAMHQRWLSDAAFVPIAARLAFQLKHMCSPRADIRFSSLVFVILMNDYKDRESLQMNNVVVFCNSAAFAFYFYGHFREEGPIYQSLVDPLFDYLLMLLHDNATPIEISTVSQMFHRFGRSLQAISFSKSLAVCLQVRKKLVETGDRMTPRDRALLMEVVELSQHRWDFELLQPGVTMLYEGYRMNEDDVEGTRSGRARRKQGRAISHAGLATLGLSGGGSVAGGTASSSRKVSIASSSRAGSRKVSIGSVNSIIYGVVSRSPSEAPQENIEHSRTPGVAGVTEDVETEL